MAFNDVSDTFLERLSSGFSPIIDPNGKLGTIPAKNIEEALSMGFSKPTEKEIEEGRLRAEQKGTLGSVKAFGVGAAAGATLGLAPLAYTKLPTILQSPDQPLSEVETSEQRAERLRALKAEHETAFTAGEWTGIVAPSLIPGVGEAVLAKTGVTGVAKGVIGAGIKAAEATPVSLLSAATRTAEKKIAEDLTKIFIRDGVKVGIAKQFAVKVAPKIVAQSMEGAVYGAGFALNESIFEDKELTAESLLAGMTTGALFGAAIPVILTGGSVVGEVAANKAIKTASTKLESIKELLSDDKMFVAAESSKVFNSIFGAGKKVYTSASSRFTGLPKEVIDKAISNPFSAEGKELRNFLLQPKNAFERATRGFVDEMNTEIKILRDMAKKSGMEERIVSEYNELESRLVNTFGEKEKLELNKVTNFFESPTEEERVLLSDYINKMDELIEENNRLSTEQAMSSKDKFNKFVNDSVMREQLLHLKRKSHLLSDSIFYGGGALVGGAPGFVIGGILKSKVLKSIRDPMSLVGVMSAIENESKNTLNKIASEAGSFITASSKITKGISKIKPYARTVTIPVAEKTLKDLEIFDMTAEKIEKNMSLEDMYKVRLNQLAAVATNPTQTADLLNGSLQGVNAVAPELTQHMTLKAIQSLNYIYQKAPKSTGEDLFNTWKPNKNDIIKWIKYVRATENPLVILEEMRSGNINAETIETIQTLYPRLYDELKLAIIEKLATMRDKKIPYSAQLQINKVLGRVNRNPIIQQIYSPEEAKKATVKAPNIASQSQRISNRRSL